MAISAELDWRHGSVETFHSSLGCFGRYFGTAFTGEDSGDIMDPFAKRTRLTPFEAFFLVDAVRHVFSFDLISVIAVFIFFTIKFLNKHLFRASLSTHEGYFDENANRSKLERFLFRI